MEINNNLKAMHFKQNVNIFSEGYVQTAYLR